MDPTLRTFVTHGIFHNLLELDMKHSVARPERMPQAVALIQPIVNC